jgi:AcrR family transcriptional regulator
MKALSLRERNKQRVTQRIVAAAVELFNARGCQQTTMDDIAGLAEISRATLFNYFPSKDALLLPWAQEILERHIRPDLSACLEEQPSTIQALQLLLTSLSKNVAASPDTMQVFMGEALKPHNKPQRELARTGMEDLFIQVLQYGQARGEVRSDIPLPELAGYVAALHASVLFRLLETGRAGETAQEIARLLVFVEAGLTPVKN